MSDKMVGYVSGMAFALVLVGAFLVISEVSRKDFVIKVCECNCKKESFQNFKKNEKIQNLKKEDDK